MGWNFRAPVKKSERATPQDLANSAVRRALKDEEAGTNTWGVAALSELQEDRQYQSCNANLA